MRTPIILNLIILALSVRLILQILWAQAGPAGKVLSESGAPIAGARVFYNRNEVYALRPPGTNRLRQRWTLAKPSVRGLLITAADGSFALPRVPDGSYHVCIASPGPGYVDSCPWTGAIPFAIAQGSAPAIATLHLKAGTEVHIRVNDPLRLTYVAKNAPAPLILGVLEKGHIFHPAPVVSTDQNGHDHSITVPTVLTTETLAVQPDLADQRPGGK